MNVDHLAEIVWSHLAERLVAQNTGIGDQKIDAAPFFRSPSHHPLDLLVVRDIGAVGHRFATSLADFLDHRVGGAHGTTTAVARTTKVVHYDPSATGRQAERMRTSEASTGAGHNCNPLIKSNGHQRRSFNCLQETQDFLGAVCAETALLGE